MLNAIIKSKPEAERMKQKKNRSGKKGKVSENSILEPSRDFTESCFDDRREDSVSASVENTEYVKKQKRKVEASSLGVEPSRNFQDRNELNSIRSEVNTPDFSFPPKDKRIKLKKKDKQKRNRIDKHQEGTCKSGEITEIDPSSEGANMVDFPSSPKEKPRKGKKKKKPKDGDIAKHDEQTHKSFTETENDLSTTQDPPFKKNKSLIRQKLTSSRLEKGLVMLSPKSEAKIYKLKKALHKKGMPEEEIKNIVRQKRRSEELSYRRTYGSGPRGYQNVCFRCRKPGHRFADCKMIVQDVEQGVGVCFRCGSTEHVLRNCPVKSKNRKLPFAKCFVCGQQGHLSNQCPSNPKGAFPQGGHCNQCGSINHLKKDCPQINKSADEDATVSVVRTGMSADALDDWN